jgi:hypothetical protein
MPWRLSKMSASAMKKDRMFIVLSGNDDAGGATGEV